MSLLGELAVVELEKAIGALRRIWSDARDRAVSASRRSDALPLRSDFTPEVLKPWLPNIVVVELISSTQGNPRFRVRLAGTAAAGFGGRDLTGMFLDEAADPEHYETTIAPYLQALSGREPVEDDVLRQQFMGSAGTTLPVRRLVMPCSSNGAELDRFVVGLFLYRPASA